MSSGVKSTPNEDNLVIQLNMRASRFVTASDVIFVTSVDSTKIINMFSGTAIFNCRACRSFIRKYGSLAVARDNKLMPIFWPIMTADESMYYDRVNNVNAMFDTAKITQIFVYKKTYIGIPLTETSNPLYTHFNYTIPKELVDDYNHVGYYDTLKEMLSRVLDDYSNDVFDKAHTMLFSDNVPYSEKAKGVVKWIYNLKKDLDMNYGDKRIEGEAEAKGEALGEKPYNIKIYETVVKTPVGFISSCRSGLLSVMLKSIKDGDSDEVVKRKYIEAANPTNYMRPTVDPTVGAVRVAEKLFEDMKLTKDDLARRFARMSDIPEGKFAWKCNNDEKKGIFSELSTKDVSGEKTVSVNKFIKEVLPSASKIEYFVNDYLHFYTFITGNKDTYPLMKWHTKDNLVSWYTYPKKMSSTAAGLATGMWVKVTSIIPFPHMWQEGVVYDNFASTYLVTIDGCYDVNYKKGASLFPECMKRDFHGVRSVIEAYSKSAVISDLNAEVSGVVISDKKHDIKLRVTLKNGSQHVYLF